MQHDRTAGDRWSLPRDRSWPRRCQGLGCLLSVVLVSGWARGQQLVPVGPEFRVNSYTTGWQVDAKISCDAAGNFVVVWEGLTQDANSPGIFGRRFSSTGVRLGREFQINTYTTGMQFAPAVGSDSSGNFVATWESRFQDGDGDGIFAQRYGSDGAALAGEFQVNTYTHSDQRFTSVSGTAGGGFVVAWSSYSQDGSSYGIYAQRYDSLGGKLGQEFRINTYRSFYQAFPKVRCNASGDCIVVWSSYTQDGSDSGIYGQRLNSSGTFLGPEFRVNSYTTGTQDTPEVDIDSDGDFIVIWPMVQGTTLTETHGQRFSSSGNPLGPEFQANVYTGASQYFPAVASDSYGNFLVAWAKSNGVNSDGHLAGTFGRLFDSNGVAQGSEFQINTYTYNSQRSPEICGSGDRSFVVVWESYTQDRSGDGVFGQRFSLATATPSQTAIPTSTATSEATWTRTPTPSASRTATPTLSASASRTATPTSTATSEATWTRTPTPSASRTATPTSTATSEATWTPSVTPTPSAGATSTETPPATLTPFTSATMGETPSASATSTGTAPAPPSSPTATPSASESQTSSPTATPSPPTDSPSPTATLPLEMHFVAGSVLPGSPVMAAGHLPAGSFRVCVVPANEFTAGEPYTGTSLHCTYFRSLGGTIPPTRIWNSASPGRYDLLVLDGDSGTILSGDNLGTAAGLEVTELVSSDPASLWLLTAGVLLILVLPRPHRPRAV
jgi:hypothetical protein